MDKRFLCYENVTVFYNWPDVYILYRNENWNINLDAKQNHSKRKKSTIFWFRLIAVLLLYMNCHGFLKDFIELKLFIHYELQSCYLILIVQMSIESIESMLKQGEIDFIASWLILPR